MYTADALSRTLQSRISLLMLAIFLLLTACHGFLNSRYDSTKHAAVSRQLFVNDSHALGVSTERGPPLSIPLLNHNATFSSLLVKRFSKDDFERYVKHGDTAYNTMQRSFTRGIWSECDSPVQDFRPQDFRNGWSGTDGNQLPPGGLWETVFDRLLGKRPTTEQSFRVEVEQTRPFTNRQGQLVPAPVLQPLEQYAQYTQYYIPALSAIIADHNRSPAGWVKTRYLNARQQPPSSQEINDRLVPPLNRWSDVTWTLWRQKAGDSAKNLRYIARSFITNPETKSVMSYIYERHGGDSSKAFPGLEFGMNTPEGRALLGTPNGIGTARILTDRATELGRREPRVRIFNEGAGFYMLWDMVPPTQPGSSSGGTRKARRHRGLHL